MVSAYADAFELLASATTGRTRRGRDGAVLAVAGTPVAPLNAVISASLGPDPDEITALAESENWEVPWSIHVRGVPSPPVTEVAARYGLTHVTREPLMVRPREQGTPVRHSIGCFRVRAVTGGELGLYAATLADGFEAPRELFRVFDDPSLARAEGLTSYLAELNGVPVGTGMSIVSGDLTGMFNITVLPPYRRHGYGRAITLEMVRAGFASGASTAYLYASEMGESVYASAGFRTEEYLTVLTAP